VTVTSNSVRILRSSFPWTPRPQANAPEARGASGPRYFYGLFCVVVVVLFVPSLCSVVELLFDCPVAGLDVAALVVVFDGSVAVVLLSV